MKKNRNSFSKLQFQFIVCQCFMFNITRDNIKLIITVIKQTNYIKNKTLYILTVYLKAQGEESHKETTKAYLDMGPLEFGLWAL